MHTRFQWGTLQVKFHIEHSLKIHCTYIQLSSRIPNSRFTHKLKHFTATPYISIQTQNGIHEALETSLKFCRVLRDGVHNSEKKRRNVSNIAQKFETIMAVPVDLCSQFSYFFFVFHSFHIKKSYFLFYFIPQYYYII